MALCQNANLTELKLAYNNLGDVGVTILAGGIATHATLTLLDLGFNNVGDDGICALMNGLHQRHQKQQQQQQKYRGTLQTLYLAGNLVGEDGAIAIADCIRHGNTRLQKLYMTGNRIGGEGVKAITEAILEEGNHIIMKKNGTTVALAGVDGLMGSDATLRLESHINQPTRTHHRLDLEDNATETAVQSIKSLAVSSSAWKQNQQQQYPQQVLTKCTNFCGMQELFLGGTGLGSTGCRAVARLLAKSHTLRVLSLPNCDMGDDEVAVLAASIKENKDHLPIESLQLSFNRITHRGMEMLTNALWRSVTLKELEVDNNDIGDRGAHHIATILPGIKNLETLDVGFNSIKVAGLNILMKTVAESQHLQSLSVSGNTIDVHAAKAVAFALAYNCSLTSIHLVHCSIVQEGQRHISAGIVSNSRTALRKLTGFEIGPIVVTLGFPNALSYWTNEQVLNFIDLMWDKKASECSNTLDMSSASLAVDMERDLDPLSFLPDHDCIIGSQRQEHTGPLDATVVVEVAKKTFETLVANGVDVFSRRPSNNHDPLFGSPLASGAIMVESSSPDSNGVNPTFYRNGQPTTNTNGDDLNGISTPPKSFVSPPDSQDVKKKKQEIQDPARKKRIVEWLCSNIQHLNELAQIPFDSRELWKLHQHYFTPVVNESGGLAWQGVDNSRVVSSVPNVNHGYHGGSTVRPSTDSVEDQILVPVSDPIFPGQVTASIPMLKRKVSYRFLGDATLSSLLPPETSSLQKGFNAAPSVAKIIEHGHTGHSLPPKNKRARRNRTRISFLPRTKAKLDSYLDVCHEKALITMRQLYFVERAILAGKVNPIESELVGPRTHLHGVLASEAEMILVDMI